MHDLLAAPFLGQYLLLRPGSTAGVQLPCGHFDQLVRAAAAGGPYPAWLAVLARERWGMEFQASAAMGDRVLVREQSEYGYGRASWEINLGCNYACSHCYLGLKEFSGLAWPVRLPAAHDAGRGGGLGCRSPAASRPSTSTSSTPTGSRSSWA